MARIPTSLLAFRMARLEVTEYVIRMLMREHLRDRGQAASDVRAYSEQVKRHFETHLPLGIPRPEMIAAVDLFFNALAADIQADSASR
ncbi:MAG: hypothetical protein P4L90_15820 [Rhodopila sp.]|nr:hypothetical protein [Rhodopila sp.]